jgi:hypothetical protein
MDKIDVKTKFTKDDRKECSLMNDIYICVCDIT